jgi:hypothetical protein
MLYIVLSNSLQKHCRYWNEKYGFTTIWNSFRNTNAPYHYRTQCSKRLHKLANHNNTVDQLTIRIPYGIVGTDILTWYESTHHQRFSLRSLNHDTVRVSIIGLHHWDSHLQSLNHDAAQSLIEGVHHQKSLWHTIGTDFLIRYEQIPQHQNYDVLHNSGPATSGTTTFLQGTYDTTRAITRNILKVE